MAATICPRPVTLTFDLLTLKSVWESYVTWGTPVQSFVFLGLLVFELEPMYATSDRRTDGRTTDTDHRLMPPAPLRGGGIITHSTRCTNGSRSNESLFHRYSQKRAKKTGYIIRSIKVEVGRYIENIVDISPILMYRYRYHIGTLYIVFSIYRHRIGDK